MHNWNTLSSTAPFSHDVAERGKALARGEVVRVAAVKFHIDAAEHKPLSRDSRASTVHTKLVLSRETPAAFGVLLLGPMPFSCSTIFAGGTLVCVPASSPRLMRHILHNYDSQSPWLVVHKLKLLLLLLYFQPDYMH